jgi:hypothetical protein
MPGYEKSPESRGSNARQVGGTHYSGSAYQHWDWTTDIFIRPTEYGLTKYLSRAGNKLGTPRVQDLEKAVHFAEKTAELHGQRRLVPLYQHQLHIAEQTKMAGSPDALTAKFIALSLKGHAFTPRIVSAFVLLSSWKNAEELAQVVQLVREEYEEERRRPVAVAPEDSPRKAEREGRDIDQLK